MGVFLNVDAGELPDEPAELFALADVVSIAGGGHAGDETTIAHAARVARRQGAAFGAHPSYDDREGFGRRALVVAVDTVAASVRRQCALVRAGAEAEGLSVDFVKPHGALYHAANRDVGLATAVVGAVFAVLGDVVFIGPADGALHDEARRVGLRYAREGFADRAYDTAGMLVPRDAPGAVLCAPDEAVAQALRLARAGLYETLCVHGDSPGAVSILGAVRAALRHAAMWTPAAARGS